MMGAVEMSGPEGSGPVRIVFFQHGILLNRWFFRPLEAFLARRGFRTVNRSYPTTRRTIEEHAAALRLLVEERTRDLRQRGVPHEVDFVTQSMGGLVVRQLLTHHDVANVRRCVFIVPPNNGSAKARQYSSIPLYGLIYGSRAGAQLAEEPPGIFADCGIPKGVEMGIIAGVRGSWFSLPSRSLQRPHDGVVSLEETRLSGVPLKELPFGHTTVLFRRRAMEEVASFLEEGRFKPAISS